LAPSSGVRLRRVFFSSREIFPPKFPFSHLGDGEVARFYAKLHSEWLPRDKANHKFLVDRSTASDAVKPRCLTSTVANNRNLGPKKD